MDKFKIGDIIHFMESNKPQSKEVTGIAILEGNVNVTSYSAINQKEGKNTIYFTDSYNAVRSNDCYSSLEELKAMVFGESI